MNRLALAAVALVFASSAIACADQEDAKEGGRFDEINSTPPPAKGPNSGEGATTPAEEGEPEATPSKPADPGAAPEPSTTTNTCQTARDLGALSGDTGNATITAKGKCSEWLRVRVTENDSWAWANDQKVTATLVAPEGSDFDLFAYVNTTSDVLECTSVTSKSEQPATRSDIVKLAWGEGWTANNSNDARTVSFEVRSKSGKCAAEAWTLLLQGNL